MVSQDKEKKNHRRRRNENIIPETKKYAPERRKNHV